MYTLKYRERAHIYIVNNVTTIDTIQFGTPRSNKGSMYIDNVTVVTP